MSPGRTWAQHVLQGCDDSLLSGCWLHDNCTSCHRVEGRQSERRSGGLACPSAQGLLVMTKGCIGVSHDGCVGHPLKYSAYSVSTASKTWDDSVST